MYAAYNVIPGEKRLLLALETGHITTPEQTRKVNAWLEARLRERARQLATLGRRLLAEAQRLAAVRLDHDRVALVEAAGQHLDRERVLDHALDRALERARAEDRVVAALGERLPSPRASARAGASARRAACAGRSSWMSTIFSSCVLAERLEDDRLVDAVQELRPERVPQDVHQLVLRAASSSSPRRDASWIRSEPTFDVMMTTVLRKSTVRPLPSVRRPSSSTCRSTLKTSGCAFSISSKSTTAYGRRRTASVSWPPSS